MNPKPPSITSASSPGVIVVGLDRPELIDEVLCEHPGQPNGFSAPIYLIEPDRTRGEAYIRAHGYQSGTRFRCFLGSSCEQQLDDWIGSHMHQISIPRTLEVSGSHHAGLARSIAARIEHRVAEQDEQLRSRRAAVERRIEQRGPEALAERFASIRSGDPARVLIVTTRYSTYIQHACEDLAEALMSQGHEALLLREFDAHSALTPLLCLQTIDEFDPDLCLVVNYPRVLHSDYFPAGLPHVCWVQDAMSHLFTPPPAEPDACDFIAGHIYSDAAAVQAFENTNRLEFPVPVSTQKFHTSPVSDELRKRYTCDIAYISHQSQPAGVFHDEFLQRFPSHKHAHLNSMRERLEAIVADWSDRFVNKDIKSLRHDIAEGFGSNDRHQVEQLLWNQYLHPMLERMLRHETLAWAGEIAERHNLDFSLYGRGWDSHPTLSRYARGELPHGEALRAAYQCTRIQLHASSLGCGHQRLGECVCSGGLMLSRRSWDEFMRENLYRARLYIQSDAKPDACLVQWRQACYSLRNHPELRAIIEERARMPRPELGWDHEPLDDEVYAEIEGHSWVRYIRDPLPPLSQRALTLLTDPYALTFSTCTELEERILRGIQDDAWRNEYSAAVRTRVNERVSMDRFASSMLEMVCDGMCARQGTLHAGAGA